MLHSDITPNAHTYVCALSACARLRDLDAGQSIRFEISKNLSHPSVFIYNALLNMYLKCGQLEPAQNLFNKMVTSNSVDAVSYSTMMEALIGIVTLIYNISRPK